MSYIASVRTALLASAQVQSVVATRIYLLRAPQDILETRNAFVLLSTVSHTRIAHLKGTTELENARVRIDAFGEKYPDLQTLGDAARIALEAAASFKALYVFGFDMFDDDTRLYHTVQDFSIWHG